MVGYGDPTDPVGEMVGRRAMALLEFQGEELNERFELLKDQDFWSALDEGMPLADAYDLSERMGQWTLDLVDRVRSTGGQRGGHA